MPACDISHFKHDFDQMEACYKDECEYIWNPGITGVNSCVPGYFTGDNDARCDSPTKSNYWQHLTPDQQAAVCSGIAGLGLDTTITYGGGPDVDHVAYGGVCQRRGPDPWNPSQCLYLPNYRACETLSESQCHAVSKFNCYWNSDDSICKKAIWGCTDKKAKNYNTAATADDGTCDYIYGCMNPHARNYDPSATKDDGSCILPPDYH